MTKKNFNKSTYPSLERVDLEIGRHYLDSNNNPVPSVTTVLSATSKSKDGIAQWRNRVGDAEADRIVKQSTDIGSSVHDSIEKYLNGIASRRILAQNGPIGPVVHFLTRTFIQGGNLAEAECGNPGRRGARSLLVSGE